MVVVTMTGVYDPDNMVIGNNLNAAGYGKGKFHDKEFTSIEKALQAVVEEDGGDYSNMKLLYQAATGNLEKVYLLESSQVDTYEFHEVKGYEFLIKENGTYSYMGIKSRQFKYNGQTEKYDWKTTVLSDLSDSTSKGYKKFVNPKETYGVLPAWGVSDTEEVKNMTVDGQGVDHVIEFTLDGATYYLWIIDDLQTESNAVDVVIDVK